jgi:hypothetical protein
VKLKKIECLNYTVIIFKLCCKSGAKNQKPSVAEMTQSGPVIIESCLIHLLQDQTLFVEQYRTQYQIRLLIRVAAGLIRKSDLQTAWNHHRGTVRQIVE